MIGLKKRFEMASFKIHFEQQLNISSFILMYDNSSKNFDESVQELFNYDKLNSRVKEFNEFQVMQ